MLNTQGVNMLMNIYFGVAANASRGIAVQVDSAVKSFANSFTTAINPQITKSYSAGELDYMYQLVCRGAKFSAFLFLFIAVPIVLETPTILKIWLKTCSRIYDCVCKADSVFFICRFSIRKFILDCYYGDW